MLDISITLVVIAHVVVSLLLILVILMQRPKQEGLGAAFGSGMTDAAWGARTTDVLQKGTVYLGTLFFVFSLVLAILMGKRSAIDGKNFASDGGSSANAPAVNAPEAPPTPAESAAAAIAAELEKEAGAGTDPESDDPESTVTDPEPSGEGDASTEDPETPTEGGDEDQPEEGNPGVLPVIPAEGTPETPPAGE